jgi:hypothetical protein
MTPPLSARARSLANQFHLNEDDLRDRERNGLPDQAFDDWPTDGVARCPADRAREVYGAEGIHDFLRRRIVSSRLGVTSLATTLPASDAVVAIRP